MKLFLCFILFFLLNTNILLAGNKEGLGYLNSIRNKVGLISLKTNNALTQSASAHAKYLIRHQKIGHFEKKGKKFYTGNTPSQRVKRAGYDSLVVRENISINDLGAKASIDNLFSAIYHRFTFLDFLSDEVGISSSHTKSQRSIKHIYTYTLGSSKLSSLCNTFFPMINNQYYMQDVCPNTSKMIAMKEFKETKRQAYAKNTKIVYYPYHGAKGIRPAFYNESPDPLPKYKVSGFPISVQFNPAYYTKVKLKKFRLYNSKGKEIKKTKVLSQKNDPHHIFTALEFALMPLARLEYAEKYTIKFEAIANGKKIKKIWSFSTQKPKYEYYRISTKTKTLEAKAGTTIILYIVPSHRRDILKSYTMKAGIKAKFLDANTLQVTLPKSKRNSQLKIKFSNKKSVLLQIKGR